MAGEDVKVYRVNEGKIPHELIPRGCMQVSYTRHAYDEAHTDKYINPAIFPRMHAPMPLVINFDEVEIHEVYVKDGQVVKLTCRFPINKVHDLTLVINPKRRTVITLWINMWDDRHGAPLPEVSLWKNGM